MDSIILELPDHLEPEATEITYPEEGRWLGITGTVIVQFVVEV